MIAVAPPRYSVMPLYLMVGAIALGPLVSGCALIIEDDYFIDDPNPDIRAIYRENSRWRTEGGHIVSAGFQGEFTSWPAKSPLCLVRYGSPYRVSVTFEEPAAKLAAARLDSVILTFNDGRPSLDVEFNGPKDGNRWVEFGDNLKGLPVHDHIATFTSAQNVPLDPGLGMQIHIHYALRQEDGGITEATYDSPVRFRVLRYIMPYTD